MVLDIIGFTLIGIFLVYKLMQPILRMKQKKEARAKLESGRRNGYADWLGHIMHDIDDLMHVQGTNKVVRMKFMGEGSSTNGKLISDKLLVEWSFRNAALTSYVLEKRAEREETIRKQTDASLEAIHASDQEQEAKWRKRSAELEARVKEISHEVQIRACGAYEPKGFMTHTNLLDTDIVVQGEYIECSYECLNAYSARKTDPKKHKNVYDSLILMDLVIEKAKAKYPDINIYADRTIPN